MKRLVVHWPESLIGFAALGIMVLREVQYFIAPRFWAEEISYFIVAVGQPWYRTLFSPARGYYSLFTRAAALAAARLVSVEHAPLVTTLLALLVQGIPIALVIGHTGSLFATRWHKLAAVGILLFTPLTAEVWLNSINSQFYWVTAAFLVLLDEVATLQPMNPVRNWLYRLLLIVAGLTGAVSCFLLPLFALKAWLGRRNPACQEVRIQTAILAGCAVIQLVAALQTSPTPSSGRFSDVDLPTLAAIAGVRSWVLPLMGEATANALGDALRAMRDNVPTQFMVGCGLVGCVQLGVMAWLALRRGPHSLARKWCALGYGLLLVLSVVSSLGPKAMLIHGSNAQRYFYAPNVFWLMLLLFNITPVTDATTGALARVCAIACSAFLLIALAQSLFIYRSSVRYDASWPVWRDEVALWRADPAHVLLVWPPGWKAPLPIPQ